MVSTFRCLPDIRGMNISQWLPGRIFLYSFLALNYRDDSLAPRQYRVSEYCT